MFNNSIQSFSLSSRSSSYSPWTSPLSLSALNLTSLLPFPRLVTTWMCHCFYHFRGSCPLKRIEVISGVPKQCQDTAFSPHSLSTPSLHKPPPPHSQWHPWHPLRPPARPVTVLTTPPRRSCEASGCIKWGCKGRRGTRNWPDQKKMELAGVNWALAVVGFLLWSSGGSAAPMECHFNSRGEISCFEIS